MSAIIVTFCVNYSVMLWWIEWLIISEYNTDEETDELLERQYHASERNSAQTAEANGPDTLPVQVICWQ